ncbi:hypothetical protein ENBRE01_1760 [Enteropsectra breve]|nr:hypothetical protein ENBRE01_1760 [Enteropsectra breve]
MIGKTKKIVIPLAVVAAISGTILIAFVYNKIFRYRLSSDKLCECYSAAVKFISAPSDLNKDIIDTSYSTKEKRPFHYLLQTIITDEKWNQNVITPELSTKLVKLHKLLRISNNSKSILGNIISNLASKIDAERNKDEAVYRRSLLASRRIPGTITYIQTYYYETKIESEESRNSIDEVSLDENGRVCASESIRKMFSPYLNTSDQDTPDDGASYYSERYIVSSSFKRNAIILSLKNNEKTPKIAHVDYDSTKYSNWDRKKYPEVELRAILYLDETSYNTLIFDDEEDFNNKFNEDVKQKNIREMHFLFTPMQ